MAPLQRVLVPTGLFIELPIGYEAQVRPRSGLALKQGITCLNTPGTIDADYRGLKQVVLNLISNAVKFTPEGGNIVVAISHANPGRLRVAVSDTGIGIAAEDLTRLARPFEQVEGQHSKTTQGTGLGLALTKSLIELHGGVMTIESQPGLGTTVVFDMPIRRPGPPKEVDVPSIQARAA